MSTNKDDKTGTHKTVPNLSELFGDSVKMDVTTRDVFGGDLSQVRRQMDSGSGNDANRGNVYRDKKSFNLTQFIMLANLVALTGILIYLVRRPAGVVTIPATAAAETTAPAAPEPPVAQEYDSSDPAALLKTVDLGRHTTKILDEAISLETAEAFYAGKDYLKAAYVYERLRRNLTSRTLQDEALADWLTLQMALCFQQTQEQELMSELFSRALNSRSPVVRALANYNLAFLQNHNSSFLEARREAYKTLALLKIIESYMPPTLEADCYFLAAESLTRYLLRIANLGDELPGSAWSDTQMLYSLPITDQEQLGFLLTEGMDRLKTAALAPKIEHDPQLSVGSQWTAYAIDGPLDQLLWQFASEAKINLSMDSLDARTRQHKTTMYLPAVDRNYLAEVAAGTAGLIWLFDGQAARVYDLNTLENTDTFKAVLVQEAIAMWQRFLLRYRGDQRTPNAHYCLGQLYTVADQTATAMGEYKLLATQYSNDPLAPYALLGSSVIKTNLKDYPGAQTDLNELLIRYPNSKIMDQALLCLAKATMENGNYKDASEMFQRVFHLNINQEARRESAFGIGRCAFESGRFAEAAKWLNQTLTLIDDKNDKRLGPVCLMLGKAYIQTEQYAEAAAAMQKALNIKLTPREYVQMSLSLAEAEMKRQEFLAALNILERIPEEYLNQDDSVSVMLAKASLYRQINVPTTAISLLRRKIEFIAESRLRALLSLELAACYLQNGELTPARRELNDVLSSLPNGYETQRAIYLLARIAYLNKTANQAESLCREALSLNVTDAALRRDIFNLLGTLYTEQQSYDRAAMAFAGVLEPLTVQ